MTTLREKVLKAAANPHSPVSKDCGSCLVYARLTPLIEALAETIQEIIDESDKAKLSGCVITNKCVREIVDAKLEALLKDVK